MPNLSIRRAMAEKDAHSRKAAAPVAHVTGYRTKSNDEVEPERSESGVCLRSCDQSDRVRLSQTPVEILARIQVDVNSACFAVVEKTMCLTRNS